MCKCIQKSVYLSILVLTLNLNVCTGGRGRKNRWIDDLWFNVLFNCISVISGQWLGDNESLCAMEARPSDMKI